MADESARDAKDAKDAVAGNVEPLRITEADNIPCNTPSPFRVELARLINRFRYEGGSNTPDFILAGFLGDCLAAWDRASRARDNWYGYELRIGGPRKISQVPR